MQMNNKVLRGARNVRQIVGGVIFFLAGAVFAGIGVYLLIKPSAAEKPNTMMNIIFIAVGAAVMALSLFFIIHGARQFKKQKPLSEEEVKANEKKLHVGEPKIENLKGTKLFFHFGGKMNQSYFVDDKQGKRRFEIKLAKFNPVGANTYEFHDVDAGFTKTVKVGKVLTQSSSGGLPFLGDTLYSRFKIDGVQCWDYLRQRGYEIKWFVLERPFTRYELTKLGKTVAKITPCNAKDPWNEGSMNVLRMGVGIYRIEIIDCRLDDAVMAAFIAARADMIE